MVLAGGAWPTLIADMLRNARLRHPAPTCVYTHKLNNRVYTRGMSRTNIEIDDALIQKARKLTRLPTKRAIVHKGLELLVRTESRKGILRYYGAGIWKGDLKAMRRNRV